MVIIDDYLDYHNKYTTLYGSKTIILMQVGSFFEVYATLNEGPDMKQLSELLDIQYTKKDKSVSEINKNNHYLLGFPLYTLHKFVDILISNQFTIVVIEQVTPPPKPKREITQIISPSTYTEFNKVAGQNNYLMTVLFSFAQDKFRNTYINTIIAWVDVSTNECFITETTDSDSQINLDDTLKNILNTNPNEIVFFTDFQTKSSEKHIEMINQFIANMYLFNFCIHDKTKIMINENFFKLSYQTTVLNKVYPNTGLLNVIEFLDLEMKQDAIICFVYLLQFAYEHNEKILIGIHKPKFIENDKYMQLINNALINLNIISNSTNKTSSVINLLNNCKTNIGKRYFRKCLINPLTNVNLINERYDECDFYIKDKFYENVRKYLSGVSDFERLHKRIIMKTLQPPEMNSIYNSFQNVYNLFEILKDKNAKFKNYGISSSECFENNLQGMNEYLTRFELSECEKVNLNQIVRNLFKKEIYIDLDEMQNEINKFENIFENVVDCLNYGCVENEFKLEKNKDNIKSISVTVNRFQNMLKDKNRSERISALLKQKCDMTIDDISSKPVSATNKTMLKILFKGMNDSQVKLSELQSEFRNKVSEKFLNELTRIVDDFSSLFTRVIEFVCKIDLYSNNAYNSINYCLHKPEIDSRNYGYISTTKIRHILIENINTDVPYIANDVDIGTENKKGMLLYGYNGGGKSSVLKSIGISLILAQSGSYVPCNTFKYSPYDKLFSRIPGSDNLFKGQSLFQSEILELRTILKRADVKSLVISDELCSGTENLSALSLISASINFLSKNEVSFLMATHLHELTDIECVKSLKNVNVYHLEVSYNDKYGIVYDRILKEGQGSRQYGLEVCKSLDLPDEFLYMANQIRQEFIGMNKNIVSTKSSQYNSEIYFDECSICQNKTEEIHHIIEQNKADDDGILTEHNIHKNRKSNLMNVCSSCHDEIHDKKIKVNGYIQTINGIRLDIEKKNDCFGEVVDLEKKVKDLRSEGNSIAQIHDIMKKDYSDMTMYRIKKLLK
jgi:DNA mismatch repair protein MutS